MNYQKIYQNIIERAKSRNIEGYTERHHIVPHCQGGSDEPENLVDLTAREHFICHMLLVKIYPKNYKLKYAFWAMASMKSGNQERYRCSSRVFEIARKNMAEASRNPSTETRAKLSIASKGRTLSSAHKTRLSISQKGTKHHRFRGYYITPCGKFSSSSEAAQYNDVSYRSILRWCKANKNGYSFELAK